MARCRWIVRPVPLPRSSIIAIQRNHALIHVSLNTNESIDSALKRFNQKMQQSGLLRELKEHAHYEKPSEKRRRAKRRSRKF